MSKRCGFAFLPFVFCCFTIVGGCADDNASGNALKNGTSLKNSDSDSEVIIRGARLYDQWFPPEKIPEKLNPLFNGDTTTSIADSWRCVTCHDWNGGGSDAHANSLYTAYTMRSELDLFRTISFGFSNQEVGNDRHVFMDLLSDDQINDLVYFIKNGLKFEENYQHAPLKGRKATGNAAAGKYWYELREGESGCADSNCHGLNGNGVLDQNKEIISIGRSAVSDPWRFLYIARFGPAYASNNQPVPNHTVADIFPNEPDPDEILGDILSYAQKSLR